jgi:hypothetical protein
MIDHLSQTPWHMPVIPTTQELEVGGLRFQANLGKVSMRPYMKNKLKPKDLGHGSNSRALAL